MTKFSHVFNNILAPLLINHFFPLLVSKKVAIITIVGFLGIYVGASLSELTLEGKRE